MGCGKNVVQVFLFVTNILVMMIGVALIIVGVMVYEKFAQYRNLFDGQFSWSAFVIIAVAAALLFVGFCGCFGAMSESSNLLFVYGFCMLVIFVLQISLGVAVVVRVDVRDFIKGNFATFFKAEYTGTNSSIIIDGIQMEFSCCGVNGPSDYATWGVPNNGSIPISCCTIDPDNPPTNCAVKDAYQEGCVKYFTDVFIKRVKVAGAVTAGIAVVEILVIYAAFWLGRRMKYKSL